MNIYTNIPSLKKLIDYFSTLPGIGEKTAERLSLFLLSKDSKFLEGFGRTIATIGKSVKKCKECGMLTEKELCFVCENKKERDNIICVVKSPLDVISIEKVGVYRGLYHVLGGYISPLDGVDPEDLSIELLISRVKKDKPEEIIFAFDFTVEAETTEAYILSLLKESGYKGKISRISYGIAMGSSINFLDSKTILYAIRDRVEIRE